MIRTTPSTLVSYAGKPPTQQTHYSRCNDEWQLTKNTILTTLIYTNWTSPENQPLSRHRISYRYSVVGSVPSHLWRVASGLVVGAKVAPSGIIKVPRTINVLRGRTTYTPPHHQRHRDIGYGNTHVTMTAKKMISPTWADITCRYAHQTPIPMPAMTAFEKQKHISQRGVRFMFARQWLSIAVGRQTERYSPSIKRSRRAPKFVFGHYGILIDTIYLQVIDCA